jgi:hypothetical protein
VRKSTIVILALLAIAGGGLLSMLSWVTDIIKPELDASAEWSRAFASSLAPSAKVKVVRVRGDETRPVTDPARPGLFVSFQVSEETWAKSGAAEAVAFAIARSAFERYGADRPIAWVQTKVLKPDGGLGREIAFGKDDAGSVVPVPYRAGDKAGAPPPPAMPRAEPASGEGPRAPSIR